jgi:quinol monooxygenase YgiN
MYARSTTMMAGSDLEAGVGFVRDEVWPAVRAMDGCVGFSLMTEPDTGRLIATSSWRSEESMWSSDSAVVEFRDRAQTLMSAEPPRVEEWEIVTMHRDHHTGDGTCVRTTWTRVPADLTDKAVEFYRFAVLPQIEQLQGFCSASLMVNWATGRGVSSVAFDSREAMEETREAGAGVREVSRREAGVEILEVAEFELVMAHLHVPELV